jgi:hypothetical protein
MQIQSDLILIFLLLLSILLHIVLLIIFITYYCIASKKYEMNEISGKKVHTNKREKSVLGLPNPQLVKDLGLGARSKKDLGLGALSKKDLGLGARSKKACMTPPTATASLPIRRRRRR